MNTHERVAELLKASNVLHSLGFRDDDVVFGRKGANHHDLIVFSKALWRLTCADAACGYKGVYLHFEYERPGHLLLHCELYPRQGSESRHPQEQIQPLLNVKGKYADLIRKIAKADGWADSIGWIGTEKNLSIPRNLQVGKFSLESASEAPELIVSSIEQVTKVVVPSIDIILAEV